MALIPITTLEQLNAVRFDLNGDGAPDLGTTAADVFAYYTAFPVTLLPETETYTGYELQNDLDFLGTKWAVGGSETGGWTPIGISPVFIFTATFDGGGHTISNLYIDRSTIDNVGLFGVASSTSTIRKLGIVGGSVRGDDDVGGLVGRTAGTMTNCYATAFVSGDDNIGGLAGRFNTGAMITDCYATGTVVGTDDSVGGFVGGIDGTITNCYATGNATGDDRVGSFAGLNNSGGTIINCRATGNATGDSFVGGFVGGTVGTITNCYSTGNATGTVEVGGLVGVNIGGTITASYFDSDVSNRPATDDYSQSTSALQTPTSNTGIYATWDADIWDVGGDADYPTLAVDFDNNGETYGDRIAQGRSKFVDRVLIDYPGEVEAEWTIAWNNIGTSQQALFPFAFQWVRTESGLSTLSLSTNPVLPERDDLSLFYPELGDDLTGFLFVAGHAFNSISYVIEEDEIFQRRTGFRDLSFPPISFQAPDLSSFPSDLYVGREISFPLLASISSGPFRPLRILEYEVISDLEGIVEVIENGADSIFRVLRGRDVGDDRDIDVTFRLFAPQDESYLAIDDSVTITIKKIDADIEELVIASLPPTPDPPLLPPLLRVRDSEDVRLRTSFTTLGQQQIGDVSFLRDVHIEVTRGGLYMQLEGSALVVSRGGAIGDDTDKGVSVLFEVESTETSIRRSELRHFRVRKLGQFPIRFLDNNSVSLATPLYAEEGDVQLFRIIADVEDVSFALESSNADEVQEVVSWIDDRFRFLLAGEAIGVFSSAGSLEYLAAGAQRLLIRVGYPSLQVRGARSLDVLVGEELILYGKGFDPVPENNSVLFNYSDVPAEAADIISVPAHSGDVKELQVYVPEGASKTAVGLCVARDVYDGQERFLLGTRSFTAVVGGTVEIDVSGLSPNLADIELYVNRTEITNFDYATDADGEISGLTFVVPAGIVGGFIAVGSRGYLTSNRNRLIITGGSSSTTRFPRIIDAVAGGVRLDADHRVVAVSAGDTVTFACENISTLISDVTVTFIGDYTLQDHATLSQRVEAVISDIGMHPQGTVQNVVVVVPEGFRTGRVEVAYLGRLARSFTIFSDPFKTNFEGLNVEYDFIGFMKSQLRKVVEYPLVGSLKGAVDNLFKLMGPWSTEMNRLYISIRRLGLRVFVPQRSDASQLDRFMVSRGLGGLCSAPEVVKRRLIANVVRLRKLAGTIAGLEYLLSLYGVGLGQVAPLGRRSLIFDSRDRYDALYRWEALTTSQQPSHLRSNYGSWNVDINVPSLSETDSFELSLREAVEFWRPFGVEINELRFI